MGKFDPYKVDLKGMTSDTREYDYLLGTQFFTDIDGDSIQKGKVKVHLTVKKVSAMYNLSFEIEGTIIIPCDRCLDDMDLPVSTTSKLIVKFGKDYSEESDEIVVIPESEGVINLAWFIYEFIVLTIPIKHVHAPGKCNKTMVSKLKKHSPKNSDGDNDHGSDDFGGMEEDTDIIITDHDGTDDSTDPRWDELKGLKEENDNN